MLKGISKQYNRTAPVVQSEEIKEKKLLFLRRIKKEGRKALFNNGSFSSFSVQSDKRK